MSRPHTPSASELPRIYGCPGYLALKREVNPPRIDSEDAKRGTLCHAAYADTDVTGHGLDDDEEIAVLRAARQTHELAEQLGFENVKPVVERRLWCGTSFCGQPDRIYIKGKSAFIPDAKFGRLPVTSAESNKQLRGYVALVAYNWPELEEIYTAIIQPWTSSNPTPTRYGIDEIGHALAELFGTLRRAETPSAPRIPGEHCKYCPVMANCPEARQVALLPPLKNSPAVITPDAIASTLTGLTLADFLARAPIAEDIIDACRAEAKRRLAEQPDSVPGWTLKAGVTETITDPEAVFARAEKLGVTQKAFMGCVNIGKTKLEAAIKKATQLKGRDLDVMLASVTMGCTTTKQSEPSLARAQEGDA